MSDPTRVPNVPGPSTPRASVLYIEDDPQNVQLVEHILQEIPNLGFAAATTAEQGLQLAQELDPSVILLDLRLPDMDGEELLLLLRASPATRTIPVVIVTGDLANRRRVRLFELGVAAVLDKPYGIDDMIVTVTALVSTTTDRSLYARPA